METKAAVLCALALCSLNARAQTPSAPISTQSAKLLRSDPTANAVASKPAIDPAKEKDIRRLLEVAGTKERMLTVIDGMEKSIKPLMERSLPAGDYRDKLIDAFFAKFHSKLNLQQLLDLAVPLYDQNFSHEEIKGLIAFYESPLGRKTVSVTPEMMNEMMTRGQKLGEEVGRTSMLEVLAEHPEFQKAIEEAQQNPPPQQ
jgi:hypothetical protein